MIIRALRGAIVLAVLMCSAAVAPSASAAPPDITPEEVISDIDSAVAVTDGFWSAHWSEMFTGSYVSPQVYGLYDGTDPNSAPVCNGEALPPMNAVYCPAGDYLAFDVGFMSKAFELGDAFLYLVVAHEWGHAIANRLDAQLQSVAGELQADCFAGAALYGAVRDGTLVIEEGDEREITNGLTDAADETAWTDVQDHGDPFQRIESFNRGRTNGPMACLPTQ